jgi:tetratricopeptide (TPR) repeat protein
MLMGKEKSRLFLLGILGLVLVVFSPTWKGGFVLDDSAVARSLHPNGRPNPLIAELQPLGRYFNSHYWAGTREKSPLYRPMTILSFALTKALFANAGKSVHEARAQHVVNLFLYLLAVWLAYRLLRKVAGRGSSLLGTLFFGLHALHAEAVAAIVGRAELGAFVAGAGGLLLFLSAVKARRGPRLLRLLGAALALFLSATFKESGFGWLFLCLLPLAPFRQWGVLLRTRTPLLLGLLVAVLLPYFFLRAGAEGLGSVPILPQANPLASLPLAQRFSSAVWIYANSFKLSLFPFDLSSDYGPWVYPVLSSLFSPLALVGYAVFAILFYGLWLGRRWVNLGRGAFVYLLFSLPVSNLFFPIGTVFGDRLWFTPVFGLALGIVGLAQLPGMKHKIRMGLLFALGFWSIDNGIVDVQRCLAFRTEKRLFTRDLWSRPRSVLLHLRLAAIVGSEGAVEREEDLLQEAVRLWPEFADGWSQLAAHYLGRGLWEKGIEAAEKGLKAEILAADTEGQIRWNLVGGYLNRGMKLRAMQELQALAKGDRFGDSIRAQAREALRRIR